MVATNPADERILIGQAALNKIMNYVASRPFIEVAQLIAEVQADLAKNMDNGLGLCE